MRRHPALKRLSFALLVASVGCAPRAEPAVSTPPTPSAAPAPAPTPRQAPAPEPEPRPSRRGECALEQAFAEFLAGEEAIACPSFPMRSPPARYDELRQCIVGAIKAKKAFSAVMDLPGIDSTFREGYVGRKKGSAYEIRFFSYDSCPSGCGDADPAWWSQACTSVVDLKDACKKPLPKNAPEDMHFACERLEDESFGDPRRRFLSALRLYCIPAKEEPTFCGRKE